MGVTFDTYRDNYDQLTLGEHRALYEQVARDFPEQAYWDGREALKFLRHYKAERVVEIGGWDGGLANYVMQRRHVPSWVNLELANVPQTCVLPGYERVVLDDWVWNWEPWGDVLVMSHVIEHMSTEHIRRLLERVDCPVYVDAPLDEEKWTNWRYSTTTHVLPYSFRALDALFAEHGYTVARSANSTVNAFPSIIRWYA